ncbi:MAG: lysine--tRNA ligase [Alphaproteobacteria bacterium]|jgi:lysyl-tRNA synthetase class 2|nr:lysine--tRNA ligase [Alphaproteobacteria bacterium]
MEEIFVAPHDAEGDRLKQARLVKLNNLKEAGINPYPYKYEVTAKAADLQEKYKDLPAETETEDVVKVAGRIKAYRNSGMFIDLYDESGKIQIFSYKKALPEIEVLKMKNVELGDIIGVEGIVRRSQKGELSIKTKEITVLSKSLATLPEKFHGLTDVEQRYRQRYVDLIVNDETKDKLRKRSRIISIIRNVLEQKEFLEVETPMLHSILGGASASPFVTHHNSLNKDLYLRIAPELFLKRLIVGGLSDGVFEINRNFRNEGIDITHNPEFTAFEVYRAYKDADYMMKLAEELCEKIAVDLYGGTKVKFSEAELEFKGPYPRIPVAEAIKKETGLDVLSMDAEEIRKAAEGIGMEMDGTEKWGQVVQEIFEEKVEHTLIQPCFITDFPKDVSPLIKEHPEDDRLTQGAEFFVNTWEVGPIYSELSDPQDQFERFMEQVKQRDAGDDEAQMMDADFITALENGFPPTGGMGLGIDRLVMLFTDSQSIREVIAFPTLKTKF